jgi:hypothetical protein
MCCTAKSAKGRSVKRHPHRPLQPPSPGAVMTTDSLPGISRAVATGQAQTKAMGCPAANSVRARPFCLPLAALVYPWRGLFDFPVFCPGATPAETSSDRAVAFLGFDAPASARTSGSCRGSGYGAVTRHGATGSGWSMPTKGSLTASMGPPDRRCRHGRKGRPAIGYCRCNRKIGWSSARGQSIAGVSDETKRRTLPHHAYR